MDDREKRIAGLVVAGGKAVRMGADKPFMPFREGCLLDAVIARVRPQVDALMLNVRPEHVERCRSRYGDEFALLRDAYDGETGPLGGVVAGLQELPSMGAAWLATFPCDTPFLPRDMVAKLQAAAIASVNVPVVAVASGTVQSLCALWPYQSLSALRAGIACGEFRSVWWALDAMTAPRIEISAEPHAFFNINTPDDLIEAERLARGNL
ncbi:MAG: NTP transferase domain-containing protein [Alphaproteobacteria bacterium]|nr:NTP transferase domain-containing protein [Alphaproteobacteria bacterium]MDE2630750.1 NTP transferase domain-containing protein [Alphaproteobacteria bacterium]